MSFLDVWLTGAATIATLMVGMWLISLVLRDAGIIDIFWGAGFLILAWLSFVLADSRSPATLVLLGLVTLWGLRYTTYIFSRWRRMEGEDARYAAFRKKPGFEMRSLVTVFWFQGAIMMLVTLPIIGGLTAQGGPFSALTALGSLIMLTGFAIEARADAELAAFKQDPANRGKVLDTGMWRWSRHPNYFGEIMLWWGIFLVALSAGAPWWTVIGPALLQFLIIRFSGADLLDRHMSETKPDYAAYMARTNKLIPLPPVWRQRDQPSH